MPKAKEVLTATNEYYESYQPQHHQSRFWISAEFCYTDHELEQRAWIIKSRANSGIHPDYLMNPSSWFGNDAEALINVYEHSWLRANAFKPRHVLTRDDFYVHSPDSQRLQWPVLLELMQKMGDYLLLRNSKLPKDHLNQPMNFFFLDLNNILKGISQNPNIQQTREQLDLLNHYVRTIEKNISPASSDRLFLANFRTIIDDKIQPLLSYKVESQLLKDRLDELSKTIEQLSTERNRILDFALNTKRVSPHSYRFLSTDVNALEKLPTKMINKCHNSASDLVNYPVSTMPLITAKQLQDCPHVKFINTKNEFFEHYAKAMSDLYELNHFQKVVTQTIELLGQAGEVYTVFQFKEQLSVLLKEMDYFIDQSSIPIEEIIRTNTHAYHKAILKGQESSFIKKWLTSDIEEINIFIENQDILNQYPSTIPELTKTAQILKKQANDISTHLNDPKKRGVDLAALAGKAQELNTLMDSMHGWIKVQYEHKGLMPPQEPIKLQLLPPPSMQNSQPQSEYSPSFFESKRNLAITNTYHNSDYFYDTIRFPTRTQQLPISAFNHPSNYAEQRVIDPAEYIKFIALFPLGLMALYLVYRVFHKSKTKLKTLKEYENIETESGELHNTNHYKGP